MRKFNKLKKLLLDTPESYYWMGFIMADGHFTKTRLSIGLSIKDENLLNKLASYLGVGSVYDGKNASVSFAVMDTNTVPLLKDKFQINDRKSYNPPETIKWMRDDLLYSFIIGFIDGDGSVRKQTNRNDILLRIKVHSNWFNIISEMSEFLSSQSETKMVKPKIDKEGYCNVNLANHKLLKHLKLKCVELKLPFLKRKLGLIDESITNKSELSQEKITKVRMLISKGWTNKMIVEELGIKYPALSNMIKRNSLRPT